MKLIFVSKCSKFNVDSKNAIKNWQKVFDFSDNCISIGNVKFSRITTRILVATSQRVKSYPYRYQCTMYTSISTHCNKYIQASTCILDFLKTSSRSFELRSANLIPYFVAKVYLTT